MDGKKPECWQMNQVSILHLAEAIVTLRVTFGYADAHFSQDHLLKRPF